MKLNPWFEEKLRELNSRSLQVIVEVDPARAEEVKAELRRMGVRVIDAAFDRFILAVVPDVATLDAISRLPGVVEIHYNVPVWIKPMPIVPTGTASDPLLGVIRISEIEIPGVKPFGPPAPVGGLGLPPLKRPDVEVIPTSETVRVVVDVETGLTGAGVKVAVIDTGVTPWHPQLAGKVAGLYSTVPEPPDDYMSHGMWVATCIAGRSMPTRFGRIEGVAPGARVIGIKALTTAGFGTAFSVIKAMEIALKAGAKVVNMSLGGPQQGPVDHDPECKAARILREHGVIVVVASGNEGPGRWTISSPGVCPDVLTVGAWSPMYEDVAWFSSRGPSGEWYRDHRSDWQEDLQKYGDRIVKPDVISVGGGPAREGQKPVDLIHSGVTGWFDGFYDLLADLAEPMRGSSMSTPHVAGLVALLAEAFPDLTVDDVKEVARRAGGEKNEVYGWGMIRLSWFARG